MMTSNSSLKLNLNIYFVPEKQISVACTENIIHFRYLNRLYELKIYFFQVLESFFYLTRENICQTSVYNLNNQCT